MPSRIQWEKNIGRRFQLRDLQVFIAVAERGSMAKAAAHLGVTQPSVSAVIAGLETSLRVQLFSRSPRGVELTTFGRALLTRGRAAFDELRQGVRDIEFLSEPNVGEVRLGCPEAVAGGFLPGVISLLSQRYPGISLVVDPLATPTLEFRELNERKLDLVLALLASWNPKNLPPDYAAEVLFEDRLLVVTGGSNPLARRRKVDVFELSQQPWVTAPIDTSGRFRVAELFRAAGVEFPKRYVATFSIHLRYNMAATGQYISAIPESAFEHAAKRFNLKLLPVELPTPRWPIAAVTLRNRDLSPVANLFLDCARQVARSLERARNRP
ncbi:MAG: LysR family transcriptional regulator [Xanthobacteraceae bacterium]